MERYHFFHTQILAIFIRIKLIQILRLNYYVYPAIELWKTVELDIVLIFIIIVNFPMYLDPQKIKKYNNERYEAINNVY